MKTINFLYVVKYPVLLFIAIFGLFIGGSENVPNQLPKPRIADIGGTQVAPRPLLKSGDGDIGGQSAPRVCVYSNTNIGGQSVPRSGYLLNNGKRVLADLVTNSTMGSQGAPRPTISNIGSNSTSLSLHSFVIGGQGAPRLLRSAGSDIGGGQSAPRTFVNVDYENPLGAEIKPIGGSQSVPRMLTLNGHTASKSPIFHNSLDEIGGKGNQPRA